MLKFSTVHSDLVDSTFQILFEQGFTKLKLVSVMNKGDRRLLHSQNSLSVAQGAVLRKLASELSGFTDEEVNKDYLTPPGSMVPSVQDVRRLEGADRIQSGKNSSAQMEVQNTQNIQGKQTLFTLSLYTRYCSWYISIYSSSISS